MAEFGKNVKQTAEVFICGPGRTKTVFDKAVKSFRKTIESMDKVCSLNAVEHDTNTRTVETLQTRNEGLVDLSARAARIKTKLEEILA